MSSLQQLRASNIYGYTIVLEIEGEIIAWAGYRNSQDINFEGLTTDSKNFINWTDKEDAENEVPTTPIRCLELIENTNLMDLIEEMKLKELPSLFKVKRLVAV